VVSRKRYPAYIIKAIEKIKAGYVNPEIPDEYRSAVSVGINNSARRLLLYPPKPPTMNRG
jgi:hypothetical protein